MPEAHLTRLGYDVLHVVRRAHGGRGELRYVLAPARLLHLSHRLGVPAAQLHREAARRAIPARLPSRERHLGVVLCEPAPFAQVRGRVPATEGRFVLDIFFDFKVTPGPPLFSMTIQLRNPFPCPVTFVTGQRLLKQSFPDLASHICTVGSETP